MEDGRVFRVELHYAKSGNRVRVTEVNMKQHRGAVLALVLGFVSAGQVLAAPGLALKDEAMLAKPRATSASVGRMAKGSSVEIVAKQGGWLQVKSGKTVGWVRLLSVRAGSGGGDDGLAGVAGVAGAVTQKSDPSRVVAVAGVRGLNEEDLKGAKFNAEEIARLDRYAVSRAQATTFAERSGLKTQNVASLPKPQTTAPSGSGWGEGY
jgi:hypothetical protein